VWDDGGGMRGKMGVRWRGERLTRRAVKKVARNGTRQREARGARTGATGLRMTW